MLLKTRYEERMYDQWATNRLAQIGMKTALGSDLADGVRLWLDGDTYKKYYAVDFMLSEKIVYCKMLRSRLILRSGGTLNKFSLLEDRFCRSDLT